LLRMWVEYAAMASAKGWVRIFLGCRAVGIFRRVFVRQPSPAPVLFVFFKVPVV
jgi:hypothetical protein